MRSVRVVDDVIVHEERGEAFLLHTASGRYYGLNPSGLIVWGALQEHRDPVAALSARWPQKAVEELTSDAETLIEALVDAGLVQDSDSPSK